MGENMNFHMRMCVFSNPKLVSCLSDSDRHETQLRICLDEFCIVKIKHQLLALLAQQAAFAQLAALRPTL